MQYLKSQDQVHQVRVLTKYSLQNNLADYKILKVVNFILNENFVDQTEFRKHLVKTTLQPDYGYNFKCVPTVADAVRCYQEHLSISHNVTVEEDSGYLLLADLVTFFCHCPPVDISPLGPSGREPKPGDVPGPSRIR